MTADERRIWDTGPRRSAGIPVSLNNLVLCCGEKTEKQYFEAVAEVIKRNYPAVTGVNFDVRAEVADPLSMAGTAERMSRFSPDSGRPYQHVWVVFDKDDFAADNFDNAVRKIESLNGGPGGVRFHALWSNECLELWFLLHFDYMDSAVPRKRYFSKLSENLRETYRKNDAGIAAKIYENGGRVRRATAAAERLRAAHGTAPPSASNPATNVQELFRYYEKYIGGL